MDLFHGSPFNPKTCKRRGHETQIELLEPTTAEECRVPSSSTDYSKQLLIPNGMEIIQRRVGPLIGPAGLPWYTPLKIRNPESG